jgi:sensor histidine kinase YesM
MLHLLLEGSIVRRTLLALLAPKRIVPILVVCVPLCYAQKTYSRDPNAIWVGVIMCLAFVLVAPVSYRVLFPEGIEFSHGAIRLMMYAAIGVGVVLSVGLYIPHMAGIGATFLTVRSSLLIDTALFLAGGYGLGRDIGMEIKLVREQKRVLALARDAEQAQLLALRSQLDPHFLFNTLNAIAEWCRTDGETAERAVLELSALLRAVLSGIKEPSWSLERELELAKTLLSLHLRRDPKMFVLDWRIDEAAKSVEVPPMILLPLVENAVTHGPAKGNKGTIAVIAKKTASTLTLSVESPGRFGGPRAGSHGVPTVERRIVLAYDGAASLDLHGADGKTIATLELPTTGPRMST